MDARSQAPRWGKKLVLLGALALSACGVAQASPGEEAREEEALAGSASALQEDSGGQCPVPTWSTPSFAGASEVATDGNVSLVVWYDGSRPGALMAARVSKTGKLLDPGSIPLNPAASAEAGAPNVAFDGSQFLVVWNGQFSMFLTRVKPDGTVVGPPAQPIVALSGDPSSTPGIACASRLCLVAWSDFGDPRRIRGALVKTDVPGLGVRDFTITTGTLPLSSYGIPVAYSDNRFLVAWSDTRFGDANTKLFATRVARDGTVLDPGGFPLSNTPGAQTYLDAVGTQQGFFVAWSDTRTGNADIFGTVVKSNGAIPDPDGFRISSHPDNDTLPSVAYDGQRVLATWGRLRPDLFTIRGNLVKLDGTRSTPDGFKLSDDDFVRELQQDVTFVDGQYFMSYGAAPVIDEPPFQVVLGTRVKQDGTRVDNPAIRISHSPSVEETALAPAAP